jgi:hypothetical protein
MSKFLLNLLVKFLKSHGKNPIHLKFKNQFFSFESSPGIRPSRPSPHAPALLPRRPRPPLCSPLGPRHLAYSPKGAFSLGLRIPAVKSFLPPFTATWAPPINFVSYLTLPDSSHGAISFHRSWPPSTALLWHRDAKSKP